MKNIINKIKKQLENKKVLSEIERIISASGDNDISLEFSDIETVLSHEGISLMGVGEGKGEHAAEEAIKQAIEFALFDEIALGDASGVLVHFSVHMDFPIMQIAQAMEFINEEVDYDADVIFGVTSELSVSEEYVKVTLILGGVHKINIRENILLSLKK